MIKRTIKRYSNRKLYDTRESRYVTLQQIAAFIRDGQDVVVVDNETREDLTHMTMAQIVYDQEKRGLEKKSEDKVNKDSKGSLFKNLGGNASTLRNLIQEQGAKLQEQGQKLQEQGQKWIQTLKVTPQKINTNINATTKEQWEHLEHDLRVKWDNVQKLADDGVKTLFGTALNHVEALQSHIAGLQGEIKKLQERIEELERKSHNALQKKP